MHDGRKASGSLFGLSGLATAMGKAILGSVNDSWEQIYIERARHGVGQIGSATGWHRGRRIRPGGPAFYCATARNDTNRVGVFCREDP